MPVDFYNIRLSHAHFRVVELGARDDAKEYWRAQPVAERFKQIEYLRQVLYGCGTEKG